jgi:hypothetical protein
MFDIQVSSMNKPEIVMDIPTLTSFFMWCSIINGGILAVWTLSAITVPDLVYRTQQAFPIPRETFNVVFYSFIGLFKIVFLVFNLVPYLALLIIA